MEMIDHSGMFGHFSWAEILLGGLILVGLLALARGYQAWQDRALERAERLKALETGRVWPGRQPTWTPARVAVATGAGVPLGIFLGALVATGTGAVPSDPFLWCAAGSVGVAAVICGTIQAVWIPPAPAPPPTIDAKPAFDPEAFDVAGRRGGY